LRPPQHSIELTQVTEWQDGVVRSVTDSIAAEEPLEIRVDGMPITVTMRTPGHDKELAAGFLWTEGLIESPGQIVELHQEAGSGATSNRVEIALSGADFEAERSQRNFYATSGCGICGKASIESIRVRGMRPPNPDLKIDPEVLCGFPKLLRGEQQVFGRTGGLHAAALFESTGKMIVVREDIGRHNATDKIVGWALLAGMLPLSHHVLMVSGRGGFEIVQKALTAGIPIVASVSAPSSLAVKLAREFNLTLIGFLRDRRFVVYAGESRCLRPETSGPKKSAES
jgi:FdhD protein